MNVFYVVFFIILLFSQSFGTGERCGTMRFMEELESQKKSLAKKYSAESFSGAAQVQERKTQHFMIYYTTEGPHAVKTLLYIDSLAKYLEQAYDLHKNILGMKFISGVAQTAYYNEIVPSGLYPVEVIDTGVWDIGFCGTYGLTIPFKSGKTQISIENDFIYGVDCQEVNKKKGDPFASSINNYSEKWYLALKVTVFHELYHSFQLAQYKGFSFWMEASATGVEEIGAPEVNDYIDYLQSIFYNPGKSMDSLNPKSSEMYSYATLYLFLYSEFGPKFDSYIWDYFSKYPKETFAVQLARYVNLHKKGEDIEDLFHKYATHIFYSGSRATSSPYKLFWEDMPKWPRWRIKTTIPSYLPAGTFNFVTSPNGITPNTDSATGISALEFRENNDSTIWVLSRLLRKDFVPPTPHKEFAAFPNPWNPKRFEEVKFEALPENSKGVEIRSANGILLKRIEGEAGNMLIWQPEKSLAPGILYYRALPYGKNKVLIVEY
jgi:hypothetical protein